MPEQFGREDELGKLISFTSSKNFVMRLVLSTLTGYPIRIVNLRSQSRVSPGLLPHEISLLRLLSSITNGTTIEVSATGTSLLYRPGIIIGTPPGYGASADGVMHFTVEAPPRIRESEYPQRRGITYWLLPVVLLAPFSKNPLDLVISGPGVITSATELDLSADALRTGILPLFSKFDISGDIDLQVVMRSCQGGDGGGGGGEVRLKFGRSAMVKLPKTVHFLVPGRVKSIRGIAYAVGVGGGNNHRMIESAKEILNQFCPDTYIYSEVSAARKMGSDQTEKFSAKKTGIGFGILLVAQTSTGSLYSAEQTNPASGGVVPEDVSRNCVHSLLEVISQGGCVTEATAPPFLILMSMGSRDVGRLCVSKQVIASPSLVMLARDMVKFRLPEMRFQPSESEETVIVSIVGSNSANVATKVA